MIVTESVTLTPNDFFAEPARAIEYVEPAFVIGYIAPAPPVIFSTPSQPFPSCTMAADTTGDSLDTTSFVNPPCLVAVVEASASRVVGSLSLLDEFTTPVHQEQIVADQIVHVSIPHILEQLVESVNEIPQERFPEQAVEQIVDDLVLPIVERQRK